MASKLEVERKQKISCDGEKKKSEGKRWLVLSKSDLREGIDIRTVRMCCLLQSLMEREKWSKMLLLWLSWVVWEPLTYTTHLPIYLCYIFRGLQVALLLKSINHLLASDFKLNSGYFLKTSFSGTFLIPSKDFDTLCS